MNYFGKQTYQLITKDLLKDIKCKSFFGERFELGDKIYCFILMKTDTKKVKWPYYKFSTQIIKENDLCNFPLVNYEFLKTINNTPLFEFRENQWVYKDKIIFIDNKNWKYYIDIEKEFIWT